jgi:hypothetical protein
MPAGAGPWCAAMTEQRGTRIRPAVTAATTFGGATAVVQGRREVHVWWGRPRPGTTGRPDEGLEPAGGRDATGPECHSEFLVWCSRQLVMNEVYTQQ